VPFNCDTAHFSGKHFRRVNAVIGSSRRIVGYTGRILQRLHVVQHTPDFVWASGASDRAEAGRQGAFDCLAARPADVDLRSCIAGGEATRHADNESDSGVAEKKVGVLAAGSTGRLFVVITARPALRRIARTYFIV
jgi:hypothetical protein